MFYDSRNGKQTQVKDEKENPLLIPKSLEFTQKEIEKLGFRTIHHFHLPPREEQTTSIDGLSLAEPTARYLNKAINGKIWHHQYDAIKTPKMVIMCVFQPQLVQGKVLYFMLRG